MVAVLLDKFFQVRLGTGNGGEGERVGAGTEVSESANRGIRVCEPRYPSLRTEVSESANQHRTWRLSLGSDCACQVVIASPAIEPA